MNPDLYDMDSTSSSFSYINYSQYLEPFDDSFTIKSKSSYPIEQIMTESLILIWKMIFKSYSVKQSDSFSQDKIRHYILCEIAYSRKTWEQFSLEKPIFSSFIRLKYFLVFIDESDPVDFRKELIKQYIPRVIAIILRYPFKTFNETWTGKMHKLLHSIIHSCEEKNNRITKYKSNIAEDSPTQIDIDLLISQLPDNSQKLMQRQSKEKVKIVIQSLASSTKSLGSGNKNLLNSIYKDSKQFKYFASSSAAGYSSYLDSVQVDAKRSSAILENISSIERLNSGLWEESSVQRKSNRMRTSIDKRLRSTRNHRGIIRDFPTIRESINEEPEKVKNESEELTDEEDEQIEKEKEEEIKEQDGSFDMGIAIQLEELAKMKDDDIDLVL